MRPLPKRPYAQIHLPALTAPEALLVANIFTKAADAIWRAHGRAMAEFLGPSDEPNAEPDSTDSPQDDLAF